MSVLGKIVGVMMAGKSLADTTPMISRLLSGIAAVVALAMLSAILGGVLLVGLLYVAYASLVAHGLEPQVAMIVMGTIILIITALLVSQLKTSIRQIKHIPSQMLVRQNPLAQRASKVGAAFIDGFMNVPPAQPKG